MERAPLCPHSRDLELVYVVDPLVHLVFPLCDTTWGCMSPQTRFFTFESFFLLTGALGHVLRTCCRYTDYKE